MNQLVIIFKSLVVLCIALCTEFFIGCITLLSFIPIDIKDFFEDVKNPIAVLVSFAIFILTVLRIVKESKNKKEK